MFALLPCDTVNTKSKINDLLCSNIASVLAKTKPDNLSFSYTPEKTDRDVADDSIIVKVRFQSTIHKYAMKKV